MFVLKKLVSQFLYPLQLSCLLLVAGLALLAHGRHRRAGWLLCGAGLAWLLAASYAPVSAFALERLEHQYRPLWVAGAPPAPGAVHPAEVAWIVVLGGSHVGAAHLPPTSRLSTHSLARVVEAVRLHRRAPHTRLLLSGGAEVDGVGNGEAMAAAARALGVDPARIRIGPRALDTPEEARRLAPLLGAEPFVLVTSAAHMPRAAGLFRRQGARPAPSPADHYAAGGEADTGFQVGDLFPQASQLARSTLAVHEHLGILWARLRGWI